MSNVASTARGAAGPCTGLAQPPSLQLQLCTVSLLLLLLGHTHSTGGGGGGGGVHLAAASPAAANFSSCAPPTDVDDPGLDCCTLPRELLAPGGPSGYLDWAEYRRRNLQRGTASRVRPAAHLAAANATYLEQLNRAYALFKALPRHDPRSFFQQVSLHCLAGSPGVTSQLGRPDRDYSVHFTWLFMPFHRMYTFFLERILAKLVGDDTFALPFWNWDNQLPLHPHLPNVIPFYFRDPERYPALYHSARDCRHLPGNSDLLVELNQSNVHQRIHTDDLDKLRASNNRNLYRYIARPGARFLSQPMRTGDSYYMEPDSFEVSIHGAVHSFVGDPENKLLDMGVSSAAAKDPIFAAHHANIDRLWAVWQSLGGKDYSDPDFLEAPFYFYEENAQLVRVTAADTLDHRALMYDWQQVDNPWTYPDVNLHMAQGSQSDYLGARS